MDDARLIPGIGSSQHPTGVSGEVGAEHTVRAPGAHIVELLRPIVLPSDIHTQLLNTGKLGKKKVKKLRALMRRGKFPMETIKHVTELVKFDSSEQTGEVSQPGTNTTEGDEEQSERTVDDRLKRTHPRDPRNLESGLPHSSPSTPKRRKACPSGAMSQSGNPEINPDYLPESQQEGDDVEDDIEEEIDQSQFQSPIVQPTQISPQQTPQTMNTQQTRDRQEDESVSPSEIMISKLKNIRA